MSDNRPAAHTHVFLGAAHAESERNVWTVIALTGAMMVVEIVGGAMFGSIAFVADGFHMSTHAGALLLAALAYTLARRRADDPRFTFGTGKFGDLAGFASAVVLAMIAALIAYESIGRLISPQPISFAQAIPIAALGLAVNALSAWLLSRGGHDHHHGHGHGHDHGHDHDDAGRVVDVDGALLCAVDRRGRAFRRVGGSRRSTAPAPDVASIEIRRPDGRRETYALSRSTARFVPKRRSPSRTNSSPPCASAPASRKRPSSSPITVTPTIPCIATTTCARRWCMSWPTRRCRSW